MAICRRLSSQTLNIIMITKDELERLKKPSHKNAELRYTIGGAVETVVHSNLESERMGKLQQGHKVMNEAVENFRNNMVFKTREGMARTQFEQTNAPPQQDRALAENTWQQNHVTAHEDRFQQSSDDLKQQTSSAFQNDTESTNTNTERTTTQHSERVQNFADSVRTQSQSIER